MRIDPESLRSYYASISDEELLSLDRGELVEMAQKIYDEEMSRRNLTPPAEEALYGSFSPHDGEVEDQAEDEEADGEPGPDPGDDGPPPDWLEDAACAWGVSLRRDGGYADAVARVRAALRAARIPSHIVIKPPDPEPATRYSECRVMVPGDLSLRADAVIERTLYNPMHEADWRNHLQTLSDEDLRALKPEDFCGALLDRAERLKRAYLEEVASRERTAPGN